MKVKSSKWYPAFGALACAAGLALAASMVARAAEDEPSEAGSSENVASPDQVEQGSGRIQPLEIRTRREHGQVITEYERQGSVYLMTVKPRAGPKQYWNDPDGDGQFQRSTSDDIDESLNLPKWRLGSW